MEQYLPECLDSMLTQTFKDWEAICVDDGSLDNCGKILDEYAKKDSRIKIIHKENGGTSSARNAGLDIATGEWISFLDADDWLDADFYESIVGQENSQADVLQFGYKTTGNRKNKVVKYGLETFSGMEEIIFSIDKCYIWNKLWKANLLNKNNIRFVEGINFCEDVLFTFQTSLYSKLWCKIRGSGYFYRYREESISNDKSKEEKRKSDKYNVAKRMLELAKEAHLYKPLLDTVKDFIVKQLISVEDLSDQNIYNRYLGLIGNHKKLLKKRNKALKKCLFNISARKRQLIVLGKNFWPNIGKENKRCGLKIL